jgi:hypothetical protein
MKKVSFKILIIVSFIFTFIACSNNGEVRELNVSAVKALYEPAEGKAIILQASASATVFFAWEPAIAEDGGMVMYEIAFDKTSGDFSDPVFMIASDKNGGASSATLTHKQLNQIAAMIGVESAETGTFKWTVFSSKGINPVKAEKEQTIAVTRLPGFAEIPDRVYITGDATEPGADLSKAYIMKKVTDGEFEIYTQLTAGKTFKFVNTTSGTPTEYSLSGEKLVLGGTTPATKTGVFKYYLDFNIGSFSMKEVTRVCLFHNWSQLKIDLSYIGDGIWQKTNHTITGITDGNGDDRYKFRMESSNGETEWRAINNDSKPTGNAAYYYMVEKTNVDQWTNNEIWKNPSTTGWNDKTYDITFSLNAQGAYTHNLVIK